MQFRFAIVFRASLNEVGNLIIPFPSRNMLVFVQFSTRLSGNSLIFLEETGERKLDNIQQKTRPFSLLPSCYLITDILIKRLVCNFVTICTVIMINFYLQIFDLKGSKPLRKSPEIQILPETKIILFRIVTENTYIHVKIRFVIYT